MNNFRAGFTLIEVMISMAILGILTVSVINFERNSQDITTMVTTQSTVQQDLRDAAAIISDEVQRAYYVFPPCGAYSSNGNPVPITYSCGTVFDTANYVSGRMNVNFSKFKLAASGPTTERPDSGTLDASNPRTWQVGISKNSPILAMISAPRDPTKACSDTDTSNQAKGCYYFVAYYPVLRSKVTGTSSDKLEPSSANNNQWVLMEYREQIDDNITSAGYSLTNMNVPGYGSIYAPGIYWDYVGCSNVNNCLASILPDGSPQQDPKNIIQLKDGNIPAIYRGTTDRANLARFTARMDVTVQKFGGGQANILMPNIEPVNGFQVDFVSSSLITTGACATTPTDPACITGSNSVDERGATEVRVRLQASLYQGGKKTIYPTQPIEVFAAPRNLPAGYTGQ
jgi:prepilin-type N-terminal cleavage/methylation domain-containing protein